MTSRIHTAVRAARGVSLLELLLALALATIVMGVTAWAIGLHLQTFDTRRSDVEQAQLARAVLKLIGDDLRSVIAHNAIDFTDAARLATTQAPELDLDEEGDESGDDDDTGDDAEQDDSGDDALDDATDDVASDGATDEPPKDLSADLTPSTIPGIYGNQYQLLMDVSRLPRIEDFMVTAGSADIPSDVKTIAYYLQPDIGPATADTTNGSIFGEDQSVTASSASAAQGWGRGLVRRALDRSVTQWAIENGDATRLDQQGELVAAEVVALELRYFDGTAWVTQWDTEASGGLPQAIEVAVAISTADPNSQEALAQPALPSASSGLAPLTEQTNPDVKVFSQVIRIPAAAPPKDAEALKTDAE